MREQDRLDSSFLDDALQFTSLESKHLVADALACHLHNTGYALEGNTQVSDVSWFACAIWRGENEGRWDTASDETRERYRRIAQIVMRALPEYQLRVAHRLIELSKVVRDIERAARKEVHR